MITQFSKIARVKKTSSVLLAIAALLLSYGPSAHSQGSVTTTYYHTDVLGSVIAASDEGGEVIWNRTYDSFGREIISDSNGNELLDEQTYTGKPYDAETGLVYLGQRYYDPELRRFLSIDPVGFTPQNTESFNRYTYANNNPYKYVDPDGRQAVTPTVFRANRRGVSLDEAFQSGSRFRAVGNIIIGGGALGATAVGGGSVPLFMRSAAASFPNATIFGAELLRTEVGFSAAGGGVLLAKGAGPIAGSIEVSRFTPSVGLFKNFSPKEQVQFVFDPKTKRILFNTNGQRGGHPILARAISANMDTVVGGQFIRSQTGQILTNEKSGHFFQNWSSEIRKQFVHELQKHTGQAVRHSEGF